jgi:hypothetical protein
MNLFKFLLDGDHGYLNNETSMFPIFIGHGPAFKKDFKIEPFNNVDIYPLMCFILGIQPAINNGSLEKVIDMLELKDYDTRANICNINSLLYSSLPKSSNKMFLLFKIFYSY